MTGDVTIPAAMVERLDDALADLLDARTDHTRWAQLRHDSGIAQAVRDIHLMTFEARTRRTA